MVQQLIDFYKYSFSNFAHAVANIFIFLPYFFSLQNLIQTLFSPWKRLESRKTSPGFSFSELGSRILFNFISSVIGFTMRVSVILFYFLFQSVLLFLLPAILLIYVFIIPFLFIKSRFEETVEQKKDKERLKFIGSHLLNHENYAKVVKWFELYYQQYLYSSKFWDHSRLFSIPPLARDWAMGFTPLVDQYSEELTSYSYHSTRKGIVDREKELKEIQRELSKSSDANIIIVGEEGVGKHTVVDALAKRIHDGVTNPLLMYKRVIKLNMEKILNTTTDQKQRELFFEELLKECHEAHNIIVFIDDFDRYITPSSGNIDLLVSLEKFAKKENFHLIGVTNPFLYQKYVQTNERLSRMFTKIEVKEVGVDEAEQILLSLAIEFEARYRLTISYETIKAVLEKSDFYITAIPFPEKAIELLDSACTYVNQIEHREEKLDNAIPILKPEVIDKILSEKTHIPTKLTEDLKQKLLHLEELLSHSIFHQEEAIKKLSSALRRSFVLLGKRKKPLATFLFLGPTGVGKTETAKTVAQIFFGNSAYLIRFDMSNYQSTQDIPTLIGSLDKGNPGLLAKAIREMPYGVLLLDEIEKSNANLRNIFLTVLDEGYFTDGFGKRVDCKNLVIIATSNAGSALIYNQTLEDRSLKFDDENNQTSNIQPQTSSLMNYLIEKKIFSPEFLNRFDGVISFNQLDSDTSVKIAQKMLNQIVSDIEKLHHVKVNFSQDSINKIANQSTNSQFGARNLDRLLRDEIEDKIAKVILEGKTKEGETIFI